MNVCLCNEKLTRIKSKEKGKEFYFFLHPLNVLTSNDSRKNENNYCVCASKRGTTKGKVLAVQHGDDGDDEKKTIRKTIKGANLLLTQHQRSSQIEKLL